MKIYLASSWRNNHQPIVLQALRALGHEVYDFRNPAPNDCGFSWRQIDPNIHDAPLTANRMRSTLAHPIAQHGFDLDYGAMNWADACVLLLPCGNSAHLEAGWFGGARKPVAVLAPEIREPELMYKLFDERRNGTPIFATVEEVDEFLTRPRAPRTALYNVGQVLDYCARGQLDADLAHRLDLLPGMVVQVVGAASDGTKGMVGHIGWVIEDLPDHVQSPDPSGVSVSFQWPDGGLVGRMSRERLRIVGSTDLVPTHDFSNDKPGDGMVTVEDDGSINRKGSSD